MAEHAPAAGRLLDPHILLYLDGVTVSFDGFKALDSLSLVLEEGELRTVIGPNGAGKTTMMDVITGKTRPDAGVVLFKGGVDLLRLDETGIARLGIGRKFQRPAVFDRLTVQENLELATQGGWSVRRLIAGRLDAQSAERIEHTLETIGLAELRHEEAGRLAHGQRQWLEIGMLLVQQPRLVLLDEPVAGMSDAETAKTAELILRLKGRHTILVVEHDMHFVRTLGAKVTVLHEGKVLAEGPVEAIQSDPAVVEVYLGRS